MVGIDFFLIQKILPNRKRFELTVGKHIHETNTCLISYYLRDFFFNLWQRKCSRVGNVNKAFVAMVGTGFSLIQNILHNRKSFELTVGKHILGKSYHEKA